MAWDFHLLFCRHARGIRCFLQRRGLDPDSAAELTQETFLRVLSAPISAQGDAESEDHASAYLYRVARNLGINHARRSLMTATLPLDAPCALRAAVQEQHAETIVVHRQQLRLVAAALADMPDRQRRAFVLHRIDGWPIARIGEHIGLSSTRTWELVHDAYRQIVLRSGGV